MQELEFHLISEEILCAEEYKGETGETGEGTLDGMRVSAIEVHHLLGPGLLESTYEECLCLELLLAGIPFERQTPLPVVYKSIRLLRAYKPDLLIDKEVIVELKRSRKSSQSTKRSC